MIEQTPKSTTRRILAITLRVGVIILWVVLFGRLLQRDYFVRSLDLREEAVIKQAREESFSGIYFQEARIGYVKNRLSPTESGFTLTQEAYMILNILEQNHPVNLSVSAELTPEMLLRNFKFSLHSPFTTMKAEGEVNGSVVSFRLNTGKDTITDSIKLTSPPFISSNSRGYLLKQNLVEGEKFKVPYFDPITLAGKDTIMEYRGYDKIVVGGRISRLHHFTQTFYGMEINSWLDETGKVIKEESPAGFVFLSEPEFMATDIDRSGKEILSSVSVPITGTMPEDYQTATQARYRLTYPSEAEVSVNQDRQSLTGDLLTITRETLPEHTALTCTGPAESLASTPYIQSKNIQISNITGQLLGEDEPGLNRVRILAEWVYNNLDRRPVLGIPDALTTLETRQGDCNEHAALFAALARNAGVPTRVVAGVTFHAGAFYYHAWNEVCLDNQWLSLDTTLNQLPADVSHIKFVQGETGEMIKIGGLLGRLKIEIAPQ
ncbi:MAG: transglutaminase domain-containing protein [Proteobacteria bacterium]|nr:transglutaminase domain-containing protein [Pseudomonadota bacterium]MBU1687996.1 transglutaminase domain-containing protein [Pseudomonadota bacterium]